MSNKRDDLRAYMDAHGLTQQQAASKLDVSSATINQYLQGKYKGDTAALDGKVTQLIARGKEKAKAVSTSALCQPKPPSICTKPRCWRTRWAKST